MVTRQQCSIHEKECRYQPSHRGGARRGPLAAQKLARERAQRLANIASLNDLDSADNVPSQGYRLHSHSGAAFPFPRVSLPPVELEYPPPSGGLTDAQEPSETVEFSIGSIRAYRCEQDLINAYYIFIHPYFPSLPPPAVPQYEDVHEALCIRSSDPDPSVLPYWPTSPLGLAIAAILALIPPLGKPHVAGAHAVNLRRSYADLFARSALESLEDSLEPLLNLESADSPQSILHPALPQRMESVLALGLLSLYEYCHRGNIPKMRLRANQALTVAMDLSLHATNRQTVCSDAQRRCWWATVFLVYLSSILTSTPPIINVDDPRITTVFPEFRGCREPWPLLVNAQVALLRSCRLERQLTTENANNDSTGLPRSIGEEIRILDSFILELAAEADRFRCVTNYQGAEADASRNLWAISSSLIHTSRITLHRSRAFLDTPMFLDERCDFPANDTVQASSSALRSAHLLQFPEGRVAEINALFPFTEEQSIRICLHSALVVSRVFRRLPSPNLAYSDIADAVTVTTTPSAARRAELGSPRSIPYMACFQLQSFYILAMVLWRVRTAMCSGNLRSCYYLLDQPSAATEVQDAERLLEELQYGMEALANSVLADVVFEGVQMMAKKIEQVYGAIVVD
ncbi:hypothetical protein BDW68DRAFT_170505 [Aspergillus falconensis]